MDKKRLKIAYVPPRTEVCAAEPYSFLAALSYFGGDPGSAGFGNYFGGSAGSASFGNSSASGGGSAGSASFENGFSGGGGGSAGQATLSTDAREFSVTFTDPWG